jgi:hypothetical protein
MSATISADFNNGRMSRQKVCHALAPSILAAS